MRHHPSRPLRPSASRPASWASRRRPAGYSCPRQESNLDLPLRRQRSRLAPLQRSPRRKIGTKLVRSPSASPTTKAALADGPRGLGRPPARPLEGSRQPVGRDSGGGIRTRDLRVMSSPKGVNRGRDLAFKTHFGVAPYPSVSLKLHPELHPDQARIDYALNARGRPRRRIRTTTTRRPLEVRRVPPDIAPRVRRSRTRSARLGVSRRGCYLAFARLCVQRLRSHFQLPGPHDRPRLRIDTHLREEFRLLPDQCEVGAGYRGPT